MEEVTGEKVEKMKYLVRKKSVVGVVRGDHSIFVRVWMTGS